MIFDVPIEPLEERYSTQWADYFLGAYLRHNLECEVVRGVVLTDKIETGAFLDVHGTNFYKASQLQKLVLLLKEGKIRNGDWVFFHDLWFPGIEMLAYIRDGSGVKFKIAGCLHAGTWDPHDFLSRRGMGYWARHFEKTLITIVDKVFVATNFHHSLIRGYLEGTSWRIPRHKIAVTGFPIYLNRTMEAGFTGKKDNNLVVFPHRLDPEKGYDQFLELKDKLSDTDLEFVATKEVCKTKAEYYDLLTRARYAVSFAQQETWGIAMQEALFSGCLPLVPARLSYTEMYSDALQFKDVDTLANLLRCCNEPGRGGLLPILLDKAADDRLDLISKGQHAIPVMLSVMGLIK